MPRRPNPNPPAPDELLRISFLLDIRREPELAYLRDMHGHGDRPRELLRLAILGQRAEAEMKELLKSARAVGFANLQQVASTISPAAEPRRAAQAPARAPKQDAPPSARPRPAASVEEVESAPVAQPKAKPAPAVPAASANADFDDDETAGQSVENEHEAQQSKPPKSNPKAASIARGLLA